MKLGFVEVYRNNNAFAKLQWFLFKLFKIKPKFPCGRRKQDAFLCCELISTEKTAYLTYDKYGFEVRCKCCGSIKVLGNGHPNTLVEALDIIF